MRWVIIGLLFIAIAAFVFFSRFSPDDWTLTMTNLGSSSSPRAVDLTGDGVLDIVVGAGYKEFYHTDSAVLAFDGRDGKLLWKVPAHNQVVGSADFQDVTNDGVPDIFIGGRSAVLYGINGKTGELLWEFLPKREGLDIFNDTTVLNFYNLQFVPDINGDKLKDILIAYGGFIKAGPNDPNRPAGYLLILDPVNGKILKKAITPDRAEIYFSPVVHDFDNNGTLDVIYGTGGETLDGHLYRVPLEDILKEDLSSSILLDSGGGKGFVAPPVLADVTGDGVLDIAINSVNGRFVCFDGVTNKRIWEYSLGSDFEIYTSPAPGYFSTRDHVPDFFVSFGHGVWPEINYAVNVFIDGKTGVPFYTDTTGTFQYASPVVYDVTGDEFDDVIFPVNAMARQNVGRASIPYLENNILIYDIQHQSKKYLVKSMIGTNLGSTPLLTDLDNDGKLDVVYCNSIDGTDSFSFKKMQILRKEFDIEIPKEIAWGGYMGTRYDGIFRTADTPQ
jgi:outer membrane protein assembly factor BamB